MERNHRVAVEAAKEVAKIWNTEVLFEDDSYYGTMFDVRLPITDKVLTEAITEKLLLSYQTFIHPYELQGQLWTRFSVQVNGHFLFKNLHTSPIQSAFHRNTRLTQIFNELSDFTGVAEAFLVVKNILDKRETEWSPCVIQ